MVIKKQQSNQGFNKYTESAFWSLMLLAYPGYSVASGMAILSQVMATRAGVQGWRGIRIPAIPNTT
ncbi:hypothetical protein [Rhodoferax sediminis]|jgi:hypothetical protein|uniref:Uncharacterized protein n=1 Tax=Rhodoferax sediminis TaxID=2509614 RepID=A0A515DB45_9BURK|nr:hypothetical protein [Rhodoferax sediminis]QDL37616.1 hypothetical protein EUB48_10305 [Rhodoferax sediminis]